MGGIIKEAWENAEKLGEGLVLKIKYVSRALESWSKRRFPNCLKQIAELKRELVALTNESHLNQHSSSRNDILNQIESLWRREEMY